MLAACVSLFLSSGQGRVYPARKKPGSFAVERRLRTGWPQALVSHRRRVGPHVCFPGSGSGCCPGWMLSPGSGKCTLREYGGLGARGGPVPILRAPVPIPTALCSFGCGGGSCIAPNLCICPDGEQGITCPGTVKSGYARCPSLSTP
ncbi:hypothetical protein IHE44_0006558 [Lamprotornis superbus]|uniref:Uncharacterized protein n=1 Tax=Lamprotornis superbus TaxID=245042 RepID=A0A835NJT1_9PASS|nr:hypothetical protein IHE44_0006558 [Lamprotornis superbus]